jgi:hypothetical protein
VAWSVRTGPGPIIMSSSLGSKLKVSAFQTSGYTDYGNALPDIGSIAGNTRVYFVLKTPSVITPSSPGYIAIYNAQTFFLGNTGYASSGPEYYVLGDSSAPSISYASDSYAQVISTAIKQWK